MPERGGVATAGAQPTDDVAPSGVAPVEGPSAELEARLALETARRHELEIELRETQRKLRWNEERLVDFVDNAPLGMQRIGSDGTILWANRAQLDLLGYTEAEYVGRAVADMHVDPNVIADVLARLSRGEPVSDQEVRLRAKDGSVKHVLISSSAHFRDGSFAYSRCISTDISRRRSAEQLATIREEQLRTITDALPVLVSFVDADRRYRFVSANYERWFGPGASGVVGRRLDEVLGGAAYEVIQPHVEIALGGAPTTYEAEVPYQGAGTRWVEASYLPQRAPDGSVSGFVALVADISERKALERARARSAARAEKLLKITSAIAEAVSSDKVFEAIVDHVAEAVDASTAALWLVDAVSSAVRLVRSVGYHEAAKSRFNVVRLDAVTSFPALDCIRSGEPIWIASQAKLLEHYPHLRGVATPGRSYRVACLPLVVQGRVLGALGLTAEDAREPSDEERELLRLVASYASQALERLRLLEVERRLRTEATASAQRLGVLSQASRALSGSELAVEPRLQTFVAEVAAALGSLVTVMLLDDDGLLHVTAVQHPNPEAQSLLQELAPRTPLKLGEGLTGSIASTGQSVILSSLNPELIAARAAPAYRAFLERFPVYALIGAPLEARGRVIGTVTATRVDPSQTYTRDDLVLLEELSERTAVAIDNARLHEQTIEARRAAEHLYRFAQTAVLAENIEAVYEAALSSVEAALGPSRAAILTVDAEGVMRFRAWRGLSSAYRAAVEGHSPWPNDVVAPQPLLVSDALTAPVTAAYAQLFAEEGIAALAFVPLVARGRLLGKFMLYYDRPHPFAPREVETAGAIANHLASVIGRFAAVSRLEETVRQNELFAGVLAHDLRNPLGAIMTAAQLMLARRESTDASERDARPLARILSTGQRMSVMIDQLLDFTQARSGGGIGVSPHEVDLATVLQQAVGELELARPEWRVQRDIQGDTRGTWDSDRLLQAVSNLVANAGQHGRAGTPIHVRLDGTDRARVKLEVHNAGTIPPELLPHLFVPFRSTQHRRAGARGLGLGLFIIREIVQAHAGTVEVTSADPVGTTFRIDLPRHAALLPPAKQQARAARASWGKAAEAEPTESAPAGGAHPVAGSAVANTASIRSDGSSGPDAIFIVDDDVDIREALAEILEQRGFSVTSAPNGAEAVRALRAMDRPPSAILLDLMMPVMDGYEFLELRRKEPFLASIPVIVITAGHGVDRARLGDATPVVPKPIELSKLMSTLQQLGAVSRVS